MARVHRFINLKKALVYTVVINALQIAAMVAVLVYAVLRANPEGRTVEIAAIADLDPKRLEKHRAAMPVGYCTDDYRRLLADPDIDLVVIGTKQDAGGEKRQAEHCRGVGRWRNFH